MASTQAADAASEPQSRLPLFYREPQPLSSTIHAGWRLKDGDVSFASETACVPIVASEFTPASRHFPIVFAAEDNSPVAVLGLEQRNLFVTAGTWDENVYVPAYVRRYPFGFISIDGPDGFVLAIDAASDRVVRSGNDGTALFENGKPSPLTQQALAFCGAFQAEAAETRAFCNALDAAGLLVERRADAVLPDGRRFGLTGFRVADVEKLDKLEDAVVVDWYRKGWLALVHAHLASLDSFKLLLSRQSQHQGNSASAASEPQLASSH